MPSIHGISTTKYKSFVTLQKCEKKCWTRNFPIAFRRFIHLLFHREFISNKKLLEWTIIKLEQKQRSEKKFQIYNALCLHILPKVKKNSMLHQRYNMAILKYAKPAPTDNGSNSNLSSTNQQTTNTTRRNSKNSDLIPSSDDSLSQISNTQIASDDKLINSIKITATVIPQIQINDPITSDDKIDDDVVDKHEEPANSQSNDEPDDKEVVNLQGSSVVEAPNQPPKEENELTYDHGSHSNGFQDTATTEDPKEEQTDDLESQSNGFQDTVTTEEPKEESTDDLESQSNGFQDTVTNEEPKEESTDDLESQSNGFQDTATTEDPKEEQTDDLESQSNGFQDTATTEDPKEEQTDDLESQSNGFQDTATTEEPKEKLTGDFDSQSNAFQDTATTEDPKEEQKDDLDAQSNGEANDPSEKIELVDQKKPSYLDEEEPTSDFDLSPKKDVTQNFDDGAQNKPIEHETVDNKIDLQSSDDVEEVFQTSNDEEQSNVDQAFNPTVAVEPDYHSFSNDSIDATSHGAESNLELTSDVKQSDAPIGMGSALETDSMENPIGLAKVYQVNALEVKEQAKQLDDAYLKDETLKEEDQSRVDESNEGSTKVILEEMKEQSSAVQSHIDELSIQDIAPTEEVKEDEDLIDKEDVTPPVADKANESNPGDSYAEVEQSTEEITTKQEVKEDQFQLHKELPDESIKQAIETVAKEEAEASIIAEQQPVENVTKVFEDAAKEELDHESKLANQTQSAALSAQEPIKLPELDYTTKITDPKSLAEVEQMATVTVEDAQKAIRERHQNIGSNPSSLKGKEIDDESRLGSGGLSADSLDQAIENLAALLVDKEFDFEKILVNVEAANALIDQMNLKIFERLVELRKVLETRMEKIKNEHEGETNQLDDLLECFNQLENFMAETLILDDDVKEFDCSGNYSGEINYAPQSPLQYIKNTAVNAFQTVVNAPYTVYDALTKVRNLNEYDDPEVNRLKASKYESMLSTLSNSLSFIPKATGNDDIVSNKLWTIRKEAAQIDTKNTSLDYLSNIRDAFEVKVLNILREAVTLCETTDVSPELQNCVYKAAYDLYATNDMTAESTTLLQMLTKDAKPLTASQEHKSTYEIVNKLCQTSKAIDKAPASLTTNIANRLARSTKDYIIINSPIGAGNPPQLMDKVTFSFGDVSHKINILGMGSPTIQSFLTCLTKNAEIDPIFRGAQHYIKAKGEFALYVSLQDATSFENLRNAPIMAVQNELENFYAITLSKNSHFYEGHGPSDKAEFEKELHKQLFEYDVSQSGCFISQKVKDDVLKKTGLSLEQTSQDMIKAISDWGFSTKAELSKEDRKFFNELYYNFMVLYIGQSLGISYLNFTCKDGIDRGMGALAWFLFMFIAINNKENDAQAIETMKRTLFTRAYWTRKRNIISSREKDVENNMIALLDKIQTPAEREKFIELVNRFMPDFIESVTLESLS